jgi:CRP-like cAMP-binding protein
MNKKQLTAFLARQALFRGLRPEELDVVVSRMELVEYDLGDTIFEEGVPGDGWYVVIKGEVSIVKSVANGEDHELARLEPGEEFGEMALLDDAPRLATALAETQTTLARLPRDAFFALLEDETRIGARVVLAMARVLCQRQRELTAILTDLVDDPETAAPGPHEMMSVLLIKGGR